MPCRPNTKTMMLYRYTDLNNLALILKNKKIRLASLNDLDDISESRTKDMGIFGHYVFVSCWTDLKEESLPFWNMYTPNMSGVQVGLPAPYLKTYIEQPISKEKFGFSGGKNYIPFNKRHGPDYFVVSTDLVQTEYTEDENKLNPIIHTKKPDGADSYAFGKLGKYKKTIWAFQSEWRFKATVVPCSPPSRNIDDYQEEGYIGRMIKEVAQVFTKKDLTLKEFFLEIDDDDAFSKMEIILGPKHKSGDLEIVNALTKTYNLNAKIETSKLSGEIR